MCKQRHVLALRILLYERAASFAKKLKLTSEYAPTLKPFLEKKLLKS